MNSAGFCCAATARSMSESSCSTRSSDCGQAGTARTAPFMSIAVSSVDSPVWSLDCGYLATQYDAGERGALQRGLDRYPVLTACDQPFHRLNLVDDCLQATVPEGCAPDVDAEASGEAGSIGHAGER